jgi:hypothetical protein
MMPALACQAAEKRVRVVEEIVESWKTDHSSAMLAGDADEVVQETADLLDPLKRLVAHLLDHSERIPLEESWPLAYSAGSLIHKAIDLFSEVSKTVSDVRALVFDVEGLERFENAKKGIVELKAKLFEAWPLPEKNAIAKAEAAVANGEFSVLQ